MTDQTQKIDPALADETARLIARQNLFLNGTIAEVHSTKVYAAPQGWEKECIRQDGAIKHVSDITALEEALENPECATLFIPGKSALTLDMLTRILNRHTLDKTIFWEV